MTDIHFEIFDNADFGNKNIRFSEAPSLEQRNFLKQNGYSFTSRYGGAWYPRTQEAKSRNSEFVKEFAERFYPENSQSQQLYQAGRLAEDALENSPAEKDSYSYERIAYLENLIAELKAERERDQKKISRLEAALENRIDENTAELEMQLEQQEIDGEAEWEKENTLTDEEEKNYIEKQSENKVSTETIEITDKIMDSLYEAAEKESKADEPQSEKEMLHISEMPIDDSLSVSPEELAIAKSVLPAVQYVSTLKFAQGEEREFFVKKIKEIAAAVEKASEIGGTDGLEEHKIVLRYFHPSGTQTFITEIGKNGDAFGFQCLNGDWDNAEWGYLNIDELKNIRGMEVDFHVSAEMTVEKFIQTEKSEQKLSEYENLVESENGQMMPSAVAQEWNEEQRMQYSQEEDEREAETATKDFETVRKLEGIVSEIKTAGFTLESKYENEKHAVTLRSKGGEVIFSARENDNIVIPVERTIAAWANDGVSEKAKSLADEFFSLVCDDGIRSGDYVNNIFTNEKKTLENKDYIHSEEFVSSVSATEIEEEKLSVQKQIQQLKNELSNPDANNPADDQYISETKEYIERLENMTDEDFKNLAVWKKGNKKENEETHRSVVEQTAKERQRREIPQEGEILSYNETHPTYSVVNKESGRHASIQPSGRLAENVRKLAKLGSLARANEVIAEIKSSGFEIFSTKSRVLIFNEDKFYDFDSVDSYFNYETNRFEHNSDKRTLNEWDFKDYVSGGLKITKRMKEFEKIESANKEESQVIYFNDLSPEQKEEVIDGYRMADDQDMLTEWENVLLEKLVQIKKDNPFISSFDIEKEISVAANPPSDEWISEYLQKIKVNFNTDFWQGIFAEMELLEDAEKLKAEWEAEKSSFRTFYEEINKKPYASLGRYMPTYDELKDYERRQDIKSWNNSKLSEMAAYAKRQISIGDDSWQPSYMLYLIQNESAERAAEKSSVPVEKQNEPFSKKKFSEIRSQCREILEKIDNSYFNEKEKKYVNEFEELEEDRKQVEESLRSMKYVYTTKIDKDGDWNINDGKEITANEARKMLSMSDFVSAVDRASFHYTSARPTKDGKGLIFFDDSDRSRKIQPYILTEEDKKILSQYEGAGGLNEDSRTNSGILNEFYTPDNLIKKVWQIVDAYAPEAKTVLEPSAGTGKFANNRPGNEFTMHELDEISARINKILHPEANVIQGAYQKQFFDESERFRKTDFEQPKYDLVIGNPPYGEYTGEWKGKGEGKEFNRYEEYFIAKGLDSLKDENSLMAFVVPSGFLNSSNDKIKKLIAEKGELIDAYRLPEGTFPTTKVGTDIILMRSWEQRKIDIEELDKTAPGPFFKRNPEEELSKAKENMAGVLSNNAYFEFHTDKILGKTVEFTDRFGKPAVKVVPHDGLSVQDELDKIDGFLPQSIEKPGENHSRKIAEPRTEILSSNLKGFRNIADRISAIDESAQNRIGAVKIKTDAQAAEEYFSFMKTHIDFDGSLSTSVFNELENRNRHTATAALSIMGFFGKENQDYFAQRSEKNRENPDSYDFPPETVAKEINLSRLQRTPENQKIENQNETLKTENHEPQKSQSQQNQTHKAAKKTQKSKWSITKSKGEVMSAEEFSHLYGRDFDEREFPIWRATDWQGNIDLSKLTEADKAYLSESENYVQKNIGEWTHKELFASGDIYAKIEEQKTLFEKSGRNALFAENISLLESVKKPTLPMEHIHFGAKTTLAEEFTVPHIDADGNKADLNLQESFILWAQNRTLESQDGRRWIDFATANISREELPENIDWSDIVNYIDGTPVKAEAVRGWRTYDMSDAEKKAEKAERRREADIKRQARSDAADRLFDRYLHEGLDGVSRARLEKEYNRRFNSYIVPDYSKLPLFVDGMSAYKGETKFKLYDQQIKGISFLCSKGNGLLAYDVGVGKTAAGIVATVNQIQTGRSRRPLIVVPNQVYAKWYTDIRQLFPDVPVNDLYNFNRESLSKYADKENAHRLNIPENSISLCTYEALKNITFTDESCENELYEDFASLLSADMDGSDRENAESSDKIKGMIGAASHVKDSSYYFFEDCGFDNLTVDEAHNFKNLWVVPRPKKKGESNEYAGIPSGKPSARALKMYAMTQLTQRRNDNRNVFMLTATPFTNSPTEVYSMLSYIGRERLKQAGITSLRAFFDEFAQTKQELGVTSAGNIDTKQVMKSWKELPALQNILTEFIDKVDGEEAGIIRPNKFTHVKPLDMSDLQKEMCRIDEQRMAEVREGNSAAVIVAMNNMRLSCVAPALANPAMYPDVELPPLSELVETSPKLKFVCEAIIDMYKGNPEKGQFMYVPLGKESHGIIKDYLVSHGIPKDAVEIINGEVNSTPEKKEKITSKFNDERNPCKIIIGGRNTAEGIDLNGNSFVMYNCSLGWNPSETIQAEGRIWRQGNLQGNVHIVYPGMNDSIDSVLYQKHDEKRSRVNELWNYKGDYLNVEDINPEDLKLDLIKDPQKKAKLILQEETKEARAELSRINLKIKSFDEIIEKRSQLELDFSDAKNAADSCNDNIKEFKDIGLEAPEWMKSELRNCGKKAAKAESGLEKIKEKLSSLKITDSGKETEYIHSLNVQKHACEEKISHVEKTLPQVLKKLETERMEQKLIEYPVEKQREILEADILNNLRPMKEVEYEVRTMRHEAMLSEKLEAGKITENEFNLYKNAGYEKYEKWLNGEIDSLEENGAENKAGIEKETFIKTESADENAFVRNSFEKIIVCFDGHWPEDRGEKGKGWKYSEKSFTRPQEALDFYRSAKIPKSVVTENENGDRLAFSNPEKQLSEMVSQHNKTEAAQTETVQESLKEKSSEENKNNGSEKQRNQEMDALYADSGSLFFGLDDSDILSAHSPEKGYRKTAPYDDFSITERQLTESEMRRDEIIFPVLNGEKSGMYKAFNDFAEHGVFDIQGKNIELGGSGKISETGWRQLQAAMEIYRSKLFETFRYVLVDRESGEIRDQLAVKSYFPNCCAVSSPDFQTIKQVITRAEEIDCMVAAVHNHPSGNTVESSFDAEATEAIKKFCTRENGFSRFAGHIILDHDTFNLYTPENGWNRQLNLNAYGNSEDKLLNKNFAFLKDTVDSTYQLENVAKKINDRNSWNDSFIPVVFADSQNKVSGVKLYDKSFFDSEPQKIRNELQFSGLEAGAVKAFPVITRNFVETMSAVDALIFEDKLKSLVERSAFMDAALPESTVTEKFNILPGRQYFDVYGAKMKNPDIEATWQTRINPSLFSEPEQKTMRKKEAAFER